MVSWEAFDAEAERGRWGRLLTALVGCSSACLCFSVDDGLGLEARFAVEDELEREALLGLSSLVPGAGDGDWSLEDLLDASRMDGTLWLVLVVERMEEVAVFTAGARLDGDDAILDRDPKAIEG